MDKTKAKQKMLDRRAKGMRYILEREDFIKEMLQKGETVISIYEGLETDSPVPIKIDGFRKNLRTLGWKRTKGKVIEEKEEIKEVNKEEVENKKHAALKNVTKEKKPYHDSSVNVKDLI